MLAWRAVLCQRADVLILRQVLDTARALARQRDPGGRHLLRAYDAVMRSHGIEPIENTYYYDVITKAVGVDESSWDHVIEAAVSKGRQRRLACIFCRLRILRLALTSLQTTRRGNHRSFRPPGVEFTHQSGQGSILETISLADAAIERHTGPQTPVRKTLTSMGLELADIQGSPRRNGSTWAVSPTRATLRQVPILRQHEQQPQHIRYFDIGSANSLLELAAELERGTVGDSKWHQGHTSMSNQSAATTSVTATEKSGVSAGTGVGVGVDGQARRRRQGLGQQALRELRELQQKQRLQAQRKAFKAWLRYARIVTPPRDLMRGIENAVYAWLWRKKGTQPMGSSMSWMSGTPSIGDNRGRIGVVAVRALYEIIVRMPSTSHVQRLAWPEPTQQLISVLLHSPLFSLAIPLSLSTVRPGSQASLYSSKQKEMYLDASLVKSGMQLTQVPLLRFHLNSETSLCRPIDFRRFVLASVCLRMSVASSVFSSLKAFVRERKALVESADVWCAGRFFRYWVEAFKSRTAATSVAEKVATVHRRRTLTTAIHRMLEVYHLVLSVKKVLRVRYKHVLRRVFISWLVTRRRRESLERADVVCKARHLIFVMSVHFLALRRVYVERTKAKGQHEKELRLFFLGERNGSDSATGNGGRPYSVYNSPSKGLPSSPTQFSVSAPSSPGAVSVGISHWHLVQRTRLHPTNQYSKTVKLGPTIRFVLSNPGSMRKIFNGWRVAARGVSERDDQRQRGLLRQAFHTLALGYKVHVLELLVEARRHIREERVLVLAFGRWRGLLDRAISSETLLASVISEKRIRKAFDVMSVIAHRCKEVADWRARRERSLSMSLLTTSFRKWLNQSQNLGRIRDGLASAAQGLKKATIAMNFQLWRRQALYNRGTREVATCLEAERKYKLAKEAFDSLMIFLLKVRNLESHAETLSKERDMWVLSQLVERWRRGAVMRTEKLHRAREIIKLTSGALQRKIFRLWRHELRLEKLGQFIEKARKTHLIKVAAQTMITGARHLHSCDAKGVMLNARRLTDIKRGTLNKLRDMFHASEESVISYEQKNGKTHKKMMFELWREHTTTVLNGKRVASRRQRIIMAAAMSSLRTAIDTEEKSRSVGNIVITRLLINSFTCWRMLHRDRYLSAAIIAHAQGRLLGEAYYAVRRAAHKAHEANAVRFQMRQHVSTSVRLVMSLFSADSIIKIRHIPVPVNTGNDTQGDAMSFSVLGQGPQSVSMISSATSPSSPFLAINSTVVATADKTFFRYISPEPLGVKQMDPKVCRTSDRALHLTRALAMWFFNKRVVKKFLDELQAADSYSRWVLMKKTFPLLSEAYNTSVMTRMADEYNTNRIQTAIYYDWKTEYEIRTQLHRAEECVHTMRCVLLLHHTYHSWKQLQKRDDTTSTSHYSRVTMGIALGQLREALIKTQQHEIFAHMHYNNFVAHRAICSLKERYQALQGELLTNTKNLTQRRKLFQQWRSYVAALDNVGEKVALATMGKISLKAYHVLVEQYRDVKADQFLSTTMMKHTRFLVRTWREEANERTEKRLMEVRSMYSEDVLAGVLRLSFKVQARQLEAARSRCNKTFLLWLFGTRVGVEHKRRVLQKSVESVMVCVQKTVAEKAQEGHLKTLLNNLLMSNCVTHWHNLITTLNLERQRIIQETQIKRLAESVRRKHVGRITGSVFRKWLMKTKKLVRGATIVETDIRFRRKRDAFNTIKKEKAKRVRLSRCEKLVGDKHKTQQLKKGFQGMTKYFRRLERGEKKLKVFFARVKMYKAFRLIQLRYKEALVKQARSRITLTHCFALLKRRHLTNGRKTKAVRLLAKMMLLSRSFHFMLSLSQERRKLRARRFKNLIYAIHKNQMSKAFVAWVRAEKEQEALAEREVKISKVISSNVKRRITLTSFRAFRRLHKHYGRLERQRIKIEQRRKRKVMRLMLKVFEFRVERKSQHQKAATFRRKSLGGRVLLSWHIALIGKRKYGR